MKYTAYTHIYFVGIGGIGMSALARYFNTMGFSVAGYDKTKTKLTSKLELEGIAVHYEDLGEGIAKFLSTKEKTLVVYTPAVPHDLRELQYLEQKEYTIWKRAKVLGRISEDYQTLAVAGTHGKTTTSTLLAHVLRNTKEDCNAFLGGIGSNFNSNLLIKESSERMVVEADEYDKSFLHLHPFSAIITSTEADHLDIYHDLENMVNTFEEFSQLINPKGVLVKHYEVKVGENSQTLTYGIGKDISADYKGLNLRIENNHFVMDVRTPNGEFQNIVLGLPGVHNAENALAVIAMCDSLGIEMNTVFSALKSFKGVKRRFEYQVKKDKLVFIDDYAHHPTAIRNLLTSIHLLYPEWPVYLIFQPHLYTRTRDFMREFAEELGQVENVILLPIYPARELPIEGITSDALVEMIGEKAQVLQPNQVLPFIEKIKEGVILTVGAGDISLLVEPIKNALS